MAVTFTLVFDLLLENYLTMRWPQFLKFLDMFLTYHR